MTALCLTAPPSPLADRAGYVPRGLLRHQWCERPCLGACGEHTANDAMLCSGCAVDWALDVGVEDYDALFAAATTPHGVCARGAR
jgi:hypothetical protein